MLWLYNWLTSVMFISYSTPSLDQCNSFFNNILFDGGFARKKEAKKWLSYFRGESCIHFSSAREPLLESMIAGKLLFLLFSSQVDRKAWDYLAFLYMFNIAFRFPAESTKSKIQIPSLVSKSNLSSTTLSTEHLKVEWYRWNLQKILELVKISEHVKKFGIWA